MARLIHGLHLGLPKCDGYSVILVVVECFTKYAHFMALRHPYTATSVALTFFNNIVKLHGLPKTIVVTPHATVLLIFPKSLSLEA
jgi:hypothetical protein